MIQNVHGVRVYNLGACISSFQVLKLPNTAMQNIVCYLKVENYLFFFQIAEWLIIRNAQEQMALVQLTKYSKGN
uniref:Uncharacterized protein n=1 Tax=Oryza glumipatula TaxID=40148 RepID=A0A0D9ZZV8_9ORYZ